MSRGERPSTRPGVRRGSSCCSWSRPAPYVVREQRATTSAQQHATPRPRRHPIASVDRGTAHRLPAHRHRQRVRRGRRGPARRPRRPARLHRSRRATASPPGPSGASCLVTDQGVVTTFEQQRARRRVAGGRRRRPARHPQPDPALPDGTLVASTVFVTGHSYMTTGFSTATEVHTFGGGTSWGNLEKFQLVIDGRDGQPVGPQRLGRDVRRRHDLLRHRRHRRHDLAGARRPRPPHAHLGVGGCRVPGTVTRRHPRRVQGRRRPRPQDRLAARRPGPGHRRVARCWPTGRADSTTRSSGSTTTHSSTACLARTSAGVTDVWSVDTSADAAPALLIEQAWSPTVVR